MNISVHRSTVTGVQFTHIAALKSLDLLDTPAEPAFDRLTAVAAKVLRVPIALLSLVDNHRQFFKSACGLPEPWASRRETPHSHSFCKYVAIENQALIIQDARLNDLVKDNLAVTELGVIGYAGMPVRDESGVAVGALCAISPTPREWTGEELEILKLLADQASAEIALRAKSKRLGLNVAQMQAAEERRHQMVRLDRHDIITPLNAMTLGISAVSLMGPLNEEQKKYLATAKRNCDAVLSIVDRMLDIGNIDHQGTGALSLSLCHAHDLLSAALDQVAPLAGGRSIRIEREDPVVPPVKADRGKITRVLVNLIGNAIKFSLEDAHIVVSARFRNNDGHPTVIFDVSDDGMGIAPEHLEKIFEEGIRLNADTPARRSSGLGLTFCKTVVEVHGGRLWVESLPGKGSTFSFSLPLE